MPTPFDCRAHTIPQEPECWTWARGKHSEDSLTETDIGKPTDQEKLAKLEAVQYENHQRRQQIERIRGPRTVDTRFATIVSAGSWNPRPPTVSTVLSADSNVW
ncbi:hypothetical protein CAEBREN_13991 [Caenorhabditis brenneri]|uniref:Uncharacterized protein n=1 Tax=Caenorhabditis brenneri TaxID=135651 RepID=G0P5A6_CAEBE|nr:hypothetical protein CAEBREN_13991 [Caenorhabditis brenneri]